MSYEELYSVDVVSYKTMLKANQHRSKLALEWRQAKLKCCFAFSLVVYEIVSAWKLENVTLLSLLTTFLTHIHRFLSYSAFLQKTSASWTAYCSLSQICA